MTDADTILDSLRETNPTFQCLYGQLEAGPYVELMSVWVAAGRPDGRGPANWAEGQEDEVVAAIDNRGMAGLWATKDIALAYACYADINVHVGMESALLLSAKVDLATFVMGDSCPPARTHMAIDYLAALGIGPGEARALILKSADRPDDDDYARETRYARVRRAIECADASEDEEPNDPLVAPP